MFYERTCNGKGSDAYPIEVPTALFRKEKEKRILLTGKEGIITLHSPKPSHLLKFL